VGNWQALMLALSRMNRGITLLMRPEENPITQEYLRFQDSGPTLRTISPDAPMGGVVELTQRFGEGDVIAIMGDRAYGAATLPVEFLGSPAQFPRGPFQLAAAWQCPIVVMFCAKTGVDAYTVDMADVIDIERSGDKRESLRRAMQRYALRLEEFAGKYPYQVHLFEDVWQSK
jgi:predicted LPLAT superfamily acyltransferase